MLLQSLTLTKIDTMGDWQGKIEKVVLGALSNRTIRMRKQFQPIWQSMPLRPHSF
jgi:hypothetical protein